MLAHDGGRAHLPFPCALCARATSCSTSHARAGLPQLLGGDFPYPTRCGGAIPSFLAKDSWMQRCPRCRGATLHPQGRHGPTRLPARDRPALKYDDGARWQRRWRCSWHARAASGRMRSRVPSAASISKRSRGFNHPGNLASPSSRPPSPGVCCDPAQTDLPSAKRHSTSQCVHARRHADQPCRVLSTT